MTYYPDWLSGEAADTLFQTLMDEGDWEHRAIVALGREVMQPRLMDWAGDLPYKYSGQVLAPRPIEAPLSGLNEAASALSDEEFNHIILNLYRDGKDNVGMHADNEPELGRTPTIASLSLGVTRRFVLQHKQKRRNRRKLDLTHGSMLVMGGTMQRRWRHGVPKQVAVEQPRINVTFRRLFGPPGWRDEEWLRRWGAPPENKAGDEA